MEKQQVLQKITDRQAVVGILGLGYVGLPLMLRYAEVGFPVLGFDVDSKKIDAINAKKSYIHHIPTSVMAQLPDNAATLDFSRVKEADILVICVPTPLDKHRDPDLSYVVNTMESMAPHLRKGQLISLESTTYPGTTEEEIVSRVVARGFEVGKDIFVAYSPEREDPANENFNTKTIPKVCGGHTENCLQVAKAFYEQGIDQVVPVSSTRAAEMTKLLENIHRAVNIGLVNEMKIVADRMDIDIHEVISAAATKPFGFTAYYPGPGLGGHCIPIDPFYLTWKAKEYGLHTRFIELAGQINRNMPQFVIEKISLGLNQMGKAINGSRILILGMSYKKNVDDTRESPSLEITHMLNQLSAKVYYSDPYFPTFDTEKFGIHLESNKTVELTKENIASYDMVVLLTDHKDYNYPEIFEYASLIVDSRGKFPRHPKVIKA